MRWALVWVLCASWVSACAGPARDPEVSALVERTLSGLVYVKGGSFWMGDYLHDWQGSGVVHNGYWSHGMDNKHPHKVTLDGFHIQAREVTFGEYDVFTRATGRPLLDGDAIDHPFLKYRQPRKPATPDWHGARAYCRWLGEVTGLPFDLPTEAQWEYAARSRGYWVGFATDTGRVELDRNFARYERWGHEVGKYPPNPLGLYDMSGNVKEWVLDWYAADYYERSPERNPRGPETGTKKVMRGGSYGESPGGSTVYGRRAVKPEMSVYINGFRCVVNVSEPLAGARVPDLQAIDAYLRPREDLPNPPLERIHGP